MVFNRVLDGDDFYFRGINLFQKGVEGGGLAGAGGARGKYHAVRLSYLFLHDGHKLRVNAELFKLHADGFWIKNAQNH